MAQERIHLRRREGGELHGVLLEEFLPQGVVVIRHVERESFAELDDVQKCQRYADVY